MTWILLALLAAFALAFQVEANRHFNCDGLRLNFWRALSVAGMLAVPCCFVTWPDDTYIYLLALFVGGGSVYVYRVLFNMAVLKQSRVGSLYSPLATLAGLLIWLAVSHAQSRSVCWQCP